MRLRQGWTIIALACAAIVYGVSVSRLRDVRPDNSPELLVALPRFVQVALAGGDRYLAANLSGFRVLVASTMRMRPEDYAVQARLQTDIAWFNAAHEDNYYVAAAILPWNGQLEAGQEVLRRAGDKRVFDWQPLFYRGFGYYHFLKEPAAGAQLLVEGAARATDQQDIWALQNLAARWIERGYDGRTAAGMVSAMAASSPKGAFRNYLAARAERIRVLEDLRDAVSAYEARFGVRPRSLEELVGAGFLSGPPKDPFGAEFVLGPGGVPALKPAK
ncbi:MAG: hypothetical protein QG584_420 [Pseudomonadota bacterium]|nr:hypothetical protein [Pseudomonadota bacterium]MDQ5902581.1 hypothetical protein [Pseudomonadota bacterium]MDQ5906245.1 hypothetical protein [Pseudomonadota bacterium]MDQ5914538.1 hypothetical protein [Pseudomonadota bacterium]MDQ5942914.1 hypothetical protein [Pseudomonadota bacterium]